MAKKLNPEHPLFTAYNLAAQQRQNNNTQPFTDRIVADLFVSAQKIAQNCITKQHRHTNTWQKKFDDLCTSRLTGYPLMLLLLCGVFWLTIEGANIPSAFLANILFAFQDQLTKLFMYCDAPTWLHGLLVLGMYRSLAWVISVMLPPMAIFFPLFTILEDLGYLPRVAFNLDCAFKRCCASGKQVLTMMAVSYLDFQRVKPLIFKLSRVRKKYQCLVCYLDISKI